MMLTLCICIVYGSLNKQQLLPYTALTDWFYITEVVRVYCEVPTESLCKRDMFNL